MTKEAIIREVKALNLPQGSYVIFGSCPLAFADIREAGDIDMLVSEELYDQLESEGWIPIEKSPTDIPLTKGSFEAHHSWNFNGYQPTLEQLLSSAAYVDGVPIASLQEVKKWKISSGRPKDLRDIQLINEYLAKGE